MSDPGPSCFFKVKAGFLMEIHTRFDPINTHGLINTLDSLYRGYECTCIIEFIKQVE